MMQSFEGVFEKFQDYVRSVLLAKNEFRTVYIEPSKSSNFEILVDQMVRECIDQSIFITVPVPVKVIADVKGPVYDEIEFSIKIVENLITNTTGQSIVNIAEKITSILHLHPVNIDQWNGVISCKTTNPWSVETDIEKNVITVHFTTTCSF